MLQHHAFSYHRLKTQAADLTSAVIAHAQRVWLQSAKTVVLVPCKIQNLNLIFHWKCELKLIKKQWNHLPCDIWCHVKIRKNVARLAKHYKLKHSDEPIKSQHSNSKYDNWKCHTLEKKAQPSAIFFFEGVTFSTIQCLPM